MAVDVLPNPGDPWMLTCRVDSDVRDVRILSHSVSRPTKLGTVGGRRDWGIEDWFSKKELNNKNPTKSLILILTEFILRNGPL